jgi:hypothetical protein
MTITVFLQNARSAIFLKMKSSYKAKGGEFISKVGLLGI